MDTMSIRSMSEIQGLGHDLVDMMVRNMDMQGMFQGYRYRTLEKLRTDKDKMFERQAYAREANYPADYIQLKGEASGHGTTEKQFPDGMVLRGATVFV